MKLIIFISFSSCYCPPLSKALLIQWMSLRLKQVAHSKIHRMIMFLCRTCTYSHRFLFLTIWLTWRCKSKRLIPGWFNNNDSSCFFFVSNLLIHITTNTSPNIFVPLNTNPFTVAVRLQHATPNATWRRTNDFGPDFPTRPIQILDHLLHQDQGKVVLLWLLPLAFVGQRP